MKLSKSSWHYKLNNWYTYGVPRNLCGYFWRTVWYTITVPITLILFIPYWLLCSVDVVDTDKEKITEVYPQALIIDMIVFVMFCMIRMWFNLSMEAKGFSAIALIFGILGWVIAFGILISSMVSSYQKKHKTKQKEKRPNILIEYIKAKKNKYCPIIEWEEEDKDERTEVLQSP
jgi:hypothetical protein